MAPIARAWFPFGKLGSASKIPKVAPLRDIAWLVCGEYSSPAEMGPDTHVPELKGTVKGKDARDILRNRSNAPFFITARSTMLAISSTPKKEVLRAHSMHEAKAYDHQQGRNHGSHARCTAHCPACL